MTEDEIRTEDDLLITADVARAIEEQELIAYLQPMVELSSGRVAAAEALVRWTMPDGTVVPAGLFVPSLERTGTVTGLDWCMAEEVCSFLEEVQGTSACVPISLNFSLQHVDDPSFATRLFETAKWHGVDAPMIRAEFGAARLLEDNEQVNDLVSSIVSQGFIGTVDSFCQGVEDIKTLADKCVFVIKVTSACWRPSSHEELCALVEAARECDLILCAEGVEEKAEADRLREAGFPYAQGYYFARPMDMGAFREFCEQEGTI